MTQSIVIQVGQCGNQIGCRFWDFALREHTVLKDDVVSLHAYGQFSRRCTVYYGLQKRIIRNETLITDERHSYMEFFQATPQVAG